MKNEKALSGLAYMFLGAAVLISGSSVQDQINRMASDPDLQMVKAMYVSLLHQTVQAKTEFLAQNSPAVATEFDSAIAETTTVAEARMPVIAPRRERVDVVVPAPPQIEVQVAELPKYLSPAQVDRLKVQMLRVQAKREAMEAFRSLPSKFNFVHFAAPPAAPPAPRMDRQRVIVVSTGIQEIAACTDSEHKTEVAVETEL